MCPGDRPACPGSAVPGVRLRPGRPVPKYGDTESFFAKVLQPGRLYEVGYPKCVCPEVLRGETADAAHCECSRQSVLYILEQLLPERHITVRTVETVLGGGTCCRFAVTVE